MRDQKACEVASLAIVCSGTGFVRRGNEVWATELARHLLESGSCQRVVLIGGGPRPADYVHGYRSIPSIHRNLPLWRLLIPWGRRYWIEQVSFELAAARVLRSGGYSIAHIPDPILALRAHRRFRHHGPRVLYKDGQLLGPTWWRHFEHVQCLAPTQATAVTPGSCEAAGPHVHVIPHFVDIERFRPVDRTSTEVRDKGLRILTVGDLSPGSNKRIPWILAEWSAAEPSLNLQLTIAGNGSASDLETLRRLCPEPLRKRLSLQRNLRHQEMPSLFASHDILVHAALNEPFGLVFLEAMASGLPIIAHPAPTTRWILGDAAKASDMTELGALRHRLEELSSDRESRTLLGMKARARVTSAFSPSAVLPLYMQAYGAMQTTASQR